MLYKYLNPSRVDVLQNLKVRFTQPCELNDPFESALLVEVDANRLAGWDAEMERMGEELNPQTDEERAMLEAAKDKLREEAKKSLMPHVMGRELADLINKAQGVLSLSRANNSLLMWGHYGGSHKGYALGLDESHPWFYEKDRFGKSTKPNNVIYTSRRSPIKAGSDDFYERLLCYKSLEWAYEEEVRIFRTFGSSREQFNRNSPTDVHLIDLPSDCIKEIFIGANADAGLRKQIFEAVHHNELDVKIFDAYVDDERYAINFRPFEA